jgi:hypothetical protein
MGFLSDAMASDAAYQADSDGHAEPVKFYRSGGGPTMYDWIVARYAAQNDPMSNNVPEKRAEVQIPRDAAKGLTRPPAKGDKIVLPEQVGDKANVTKYFSTIEASDHGGWVAVFI